MRGPRNSASINAEFSPDDAHGIVWAVDLNSPGVSLTEYELLALLAYLAEGDGSTCIVICSQDPRRVPSCENRYAAEGAYQFLMSRGMQGRVLTAPVDSATQGGPVVKLARRVHALADDSVPGNVREFVRAFLDAWSNRDQAIELVDPELRQEYEEDDLRMLMSGVSNPHHAGYFLHSVAPCAGGWLVVVSLLEHYTGEALELNPLAVLCAFKVVSRDGTCFVSTITAQDAQGIQWPETSPVVLRTDGPQLFCPQRGDPDGDGRMDTLILYRATGNCLAGLRGVVIEDELPRKVKPLQGSYDLGEGTGCERPFFRDMDGDGRDEITVFSGTGAYIHVLSVFKWDGQDYVFCGDTGGDVSARLGDLNGDGILEAIGENGFYGPGLDSPAEVKVVRVNRLVGLKLEPVDWWLEPSRPCEGRYSHPEETVIEFYASIEEAMRVGWDLAAAYERTCGELGIELPHSLLDETLKGIRKALLKDLAILSADLSSAEVAVTLEATRSLPDGRRPEVHRATWHLSRGDSGWRLDGLVETRTQAE
jgi:hypothetical protein